MSKVYLITVRGRVARYATLQAALNAASVIFAKTGIVVGIEESTP